MTINELQRMLIEEIETLTKDMQLVNKKGAARLKGYPQAIPIAPAFEEELSEDGGLVMDDDMLFPYFIVRAETIEYCRESKDMGEANQADLFIAFAVYDDDPGLKGYFTLTAVMERVVKRFQTNTVLGPFFCDRKMDAAFQEDNTYPYFYGALEMQWYLPEISMDPGIEEFL